jgi:hypothetical protein
MSQNPIHRLRQGIDTSVRSRRGRSFGIATIDPDGPASCPGSSIDVAPPVSGQEAAAQIDSILSRCAEHQARQRLSAITCIAVVMITGKYVIQWQLGAQPAGDFLDNFALLAPSGHIGLIGNNQKKKFLFLESR